MPMLRYHRPPTLVKMFFQGQRAPAKFSEGAEKMLQNKERKEELLYSWTCMKRYG